MSSCIRKLVVDLDDTLIFEWDFVSGGYRAVAQILSSELTNETPDALFNRLVYEHHKHGRRGIIDRIVNQVHADPGLIPRLVAAYREHAPAVPLMPGAVDALVCLRNAGFSVAVVTDGAVEIQQRKVRAARLVDIVDTVVYCWGVGAPKPDTGGFAEAMRRLHAVPENTLIVGDDPYLDIVPALRLGVAACRVRTGRYGLVANLPDSVVIRDLPSFVAVAEWLLRPSP